MDERRYLVIKAFAYFIPGDRVLLPQWAVPVLIRSGHIEAAREAAHA